jgi:predicted molibdopterin-dependent oxidoreductase YjgC
MPNVFPGSQRVNDDAIRAKFEKAWGVSLPAKVGMATSEILNAAHAGTLKALWIVGENVVMGDPDVHHVVDALQHLDFLVVSELFLTETAQMADVVLPAASFAEQDGTFTNTERRIQRVRKAVEPPGEARADWEIICAVAKRMGAPGGWDYCSAGQIMDEVASLTPAFAGVSYERIDQRGLQWPVPSKDHPGTPILHVGKFTRGLGLFTPVEHQEPAELPDAEYPLTLTTGRLLQHYHTGSMTRRCAGLEQMAPEERVEIHSGDAAQLGIANWDWVCVRSRRGEVAARAWVTDRVKRGVVYMTFHYREALTNVLTNGAVCPIAKVPEYKVCAIRVERLAGPPTGELEIDRLIRSRKPAPVG